MILTGCDNLKDATMDILIDPDYSQMNEFKK